MHLSAAGQWDGGNPWRDPERSENPYRCRSRLHGAQWQVGRPVKQFLDVFLVEPSLSRTTPYATDKEQIYAEIISVAKLPNGNSAFQNYLRQRPRLLR